MRNCRRCGVEFSAVGGRGRAPVYCSAECRATPKPDVFCRFCGKRVELDSLGGTRKKYCDESCKNRLRSAAKRPAPRVLSCRVCSVQFETQRQNAVTCGAEHCQYENLRLNMRERERKARALLPPMKVQTCAWCKGEIVTPRSYTGTRLYHESCKRQSRRAHYRQKNTMRRGVVGAQRIGVDQVGERDGWVCQLCGEPVDSSLSGMHPQGPTVDHILPISKGGQDVLDNVQLAHRRCNTLKGARVE